MTLTMPRPVIVPFRWLNHALDLRTYIEGDEPLFHAGDVCTALDVPLVDGDEDWMTGATPKVYPLPVLHVPGHLERSGLPMPFFTADQVRELADTRPMILQHDFLSWFEETLTDHLIGDQLEQLLGTSLPAEPGLSELLAYDVAQAARILSRDPVLTYGQKTLFAALHEDLGLITRESDIWIPTKEALRAGYLVRRHRYIGGTKSIYPQILITGSGLQHIHQRLGGTADIRVNPNAPAPLMEI